MILVLKLDFNGWGEESPSFAGLSGLGIVAGLDSPLASTTDPMIKLVFPLMVEYSL